MIDYVKGGEGTFGELSKWLDMRLHKAQLPAGHTSSWNFGLVIVHLDAWRRGRMATYFERIAQLVLKESIVAPDSLLYGLGLAYYMLRGGRVQCFPSLTTVDSLGFLSPLDYQGAGITPHMMKNAVVLHFNGPRKPWLRKNGEKSLRAKHLIPIVIFADARHGTEWLSDQLGSLGKHVCGGESTRHLAPHSEALIPFRPLNCSTCGFFSPWVIGRRSIPNEGLEERPKPTCKRRDMCKWNYIKAIATRQLNYSSHAESHQGWAEGWVSWMETSNATISELYAKYVEQLMTLHLPFSERQEPWLPCICDADSKYLVTKLFRIWFTPTHANSRSPSYPSYRLPHDPRPGINPISVLTQYHARFIHLQRDPLNSIISFAQAKVSDHYHCGLNLTRGATDSSNMQDTSCERYASERSHMSIWLNPGRVAFVMSRNLRLMQEIKRMQKGRSDFLFDATFEFCAQDGFVSCLERIFHAIGVHRMPGTAIVNFFSHESNMWDTVQNAEQILGVINFLRDRGLEYESGLPPAAETRRFNLSWLPPPSMNQGAARLATVDDLRVSNLHTGATALRPVEPTRKLVLLQVPKCSGTAVHFMLRFASAFRECTGAVGHARAVNPQSPTVLKQWWTSTVSNLTQVAASRATMDSCTFLSMESSPLSRYDPSGADTRANLAHLLQVFGRGPQIIMFFRHPVMRCRLHFSKLQGNCLTRHPSTGLSCNDHFASQSVQETFTRGCEDRMLSTVIDLRDPRYAPLRGPRHTSMRVVDDAVSLVQEHVASIGLSEHLAASICMFFGQAGLLLRPEVCACDGSHAASMEAWLPSEEITSRPVVPLNVSDEDLRQRLHRDDTFFSSISHSFIRRVRLFEAQVKLRLICSPDTSLTPTPPLRA